MAFYCDRCGEPNDQDDMDECSACGGEEHFCRYCGSPTNSYDDTCNYCQEMIDTGDPGLLLDEEDEEFLRGPFNR